MDESATIGNQVTVASPENDYAELRRVVDVFLEERRGQFQPRTIMNYQRTIGVVVTGLAGKPFDLECVTEWLIRRHSEGTNATTLMAYRTNILALLRWMRDRKLVDWKLDNRTSFRMGPSQRKQMEATDYERLLKFSTNNPKYKFMEYAIRTAWETGLRMSDVCHLAWTNINLQTRSLQIRPRKTKRFLKNVEIPLSDDYIKFLMRLRESRDMNSPYVSPKLAYMYDRSEGADVGLAFRELRKYAGIEKHKDFHSFRTGWMTRMASGGMNMAMISDMMAVSLNHVMAYCKPTLEDKRQAIEACKPKSRLMPIT